MRLSTWVKQLAAHPALETVFNSLESRATWHAVAPEARPLLLACTYLARPRKVLLVTGNYERALHWQARLVMCGVPESQIEQLPSGLSALFEDAAPETIALSDRIGALRFLVSESPGIVITSPEAALERTLPRDVLLDSNVEIESGSTIEPDELARKLAMLGYEKAEPVRQPGQFGQRGGIFDIFAMGADIPVRLEFFGDEIDSIRQFDPATQRSIGNINRLVLAPSRETLYAFGDAHSEPEIRAACEGIREMILRACEVEAPDLPDESQKNLEELLRGDANAIGSGVFFDRLDLYRPLIHPDSGCAVDLLPEDGLLVLDEPNELDNIAGRAADDLAQAFQARHQRGEILKSYVTDYVVNADRLGDHDRTLALNVLGGAPDWLQGTTEHDLGITSLEPYRGRSETLASTMKAWREAGYTLIFATDQPNRAKTMLGQIEIHPQEKEPEEPGYYLAHGNLAGGFLAPEIKTAVVTDHELFGVGRLRLPQRKFNEGAPISTVLDLKPGDYVVHIHFGIGIFQGLTKRTVDGVEKEFLFIQYAGPDKLFVPADQLDRVQKYLNPGDAEPKLNRIQGGEWQRTVGKAREEAREFARDLIKLYASRKQVQRQGYGPDSPWQGEMESTFPWVETPSQMRAIKEAKADLQLDYPMDRLVCGDVGFGKTEVAIRAAFKVAQAGRQVAFLCPTTILSEQHYRSFCERLAAFPVRLDILNRFRTAAEKREIQDKLEDGEIDVIIGTHSLLGKGLKFKDLGMVVIDEEQKFGVKQKEALKELRVNVDVLTMSATPIPRTLSMALMDIRQMSLINDPPPGRLPIRTFVRAHSDEVVREAILREMARGGQVYYVFNRVTGIYHIAERIKKLVPNARIAVGHGQMSEQELEPVMVGFIRGEIDILVCTTIVESGLDIPNANTMLVDNAERLGLAQLYQLRGRVGRSDRQAYAYFMYAKEESLTENALARLKSLQEFSSLGSGYSLAFRDLQIRGAGELLGAKQSGTMATVGYELFCQIIHEEVQFLKSHADGESPTYRDPLEGLEALPTVDLPVSAMIPPNYIDDQGQRLYYYKLMMSQREESGLAEAMAEIADRYGALPEELMSAMRIMRQRMAAARLSMTKVDGHGGRLAVTFSEDVDFPPRLWSMLTARNRQCFFTRGQFVWAFSGSPLVACEEMTSVFATTLAELEAQRAALGL